MVMLVQTWQSKLPRERSTALLCGLGQVGALCSVLLLIWGVLWGAQLDAISLWLGVV